jgi:hypothetical protein
MLGNGAVCTLSHLAVSTDSSPSTQEKIRQDRLRALCFGGVRSFLQIQAARRPGCPPRPRLRMITYLLGTLPNLLFALVVVIPECCPRQPPPFYISSNMSLEGIFSKPHFY